MKRLGFLAALAACVLPAWAGYIYYLTDANLVSYWLHWNASGQIQAGSWSGSNGSYQGVNAPIQDGQYISGVLISSIAVPDGTNSYEVRATLRGVGAFSGNASIFLRASSIPR